MDSLLVFAFGLMLGMLAGIALLAVWFRLTLTEIKKIYDALPQGCVTCPLMARNLHAADILSSSMVENASEEPAHP